MYQFTASFIKEDAWYVTQALEPSVTSQRKTLDDVKKNLLKAKL